MSETVYDDSQWTTTCFRSFPPRLPLLTLLWPPGLLVSIFAAFCSLCSELPSGSVITGSSHLSDFKRDVSSFQPPKSTPVLVLILSSPALIAIGKWFIVYLFEHHLPLLTRICHTWGQRPCLELFLLESFQKHSRHSVNKGLSECMTLHTRGDLFSWYITQRLVFFPWPKPG